MRSRAWAFGFLACLVSARAFAGEWRLRAREEYENGPLNLGDGRGDIRYDGFSSAFTLFYEEPFKTSYGLTVHHGVLDERNTTRAVRVTKIGLEAKHFPTQEARLFFLRGALVGAGIDPSDQGGDFWLWGPSLGAGFEFPLWRLGIAPEVGGHFLWGSRGKSLRDLYVALGIHFYIFKHDKKPSGAAHDK